MSASANNRNRVWILWVTKSTAEFRVALGYIEGLSFSLGGRYIYDGHESTSSRNDRKYYSSIVYEF